jgi:Phage derived protein Gp49-like (DUF891)
MGGGIDWKFRSFVSENGRSIVQDWYDRQTKTVRAEFDTTLEYLRDLPPTNWNRPFVGLLGGECDGLVEIRFKVDRVQHRPLGCYGPSQLEFTILFFAIEKDRKFQPPNACPIARRRKTLVLGGGQYSCEWNVS